MIRKKILSQLRRGLREGDTQRLSVAIIGLGLIAMIRLMRGPGSRKIYSRTIKSDESIQLRLRERPGQRPANST